PWLAALLACFTGTKTASKRHRALERSLRSGGDVVLDTTILRVDQRHNASVYDPRRVVAGTLTTAITWRELGLLTGCTHSLLISAGLGGAWGGHYAYRSVHPMSKAGLSTLGRQLPAESSMLLTFAETKDPPLLLQAAEREQTAQASVASIADDLTTEVFSGRDAVETHPQLPANAPRAESDRLSMILLRYPDTTTAGQVASQLAAGESDGGRPGVELVVATDRSGKRRVSDPKFGSHAIGHGNLISWGLLGLVCGALAGIPGGGGIFGILEGGVVTGVGWGAFGAAAGALYGLWAGRGISARPLKSPRRVPRPGTSRPPL